MTALGNSVGKTNHMKGAGAWEVLGEDPALVSAHDAIREHVTVV